MSEAKQPFGVLFSDVFGVDPVNVEAYGALDISLVADLPLFIDPFLLFHSEKPEYQKLHRGIIAYLKFLRDESVAGNLTDGHLKLWLHFKEINNTWLGFAVDSNRGSGLGNDFARTLRTNFGRILNPEQERVTKDYHLEKLCLIAGGVGRDRISDFTTNLIKGFLCEFTQEFAKANISPVLRRTVTVTKVEFNYATKAWKSKAYDLPWFERDYVLLVPTDMLARDETWINNSDLAARFEHLPESLPNDALRAQVNSYFMSLLPDEEEPTAKQKQEARRQTLLEYPELVDYYIRWKEETGDEAKSIADLDVEEVRQLFSRNGRELILLLQASGFYDLEGNAYENALARALFFKQVIENQDGYRFFWNGDSLLPRRESDVQSLFKLTWFGSAFDANAEVNNGRGPVDFKISNGSWNKALIEFKIAKNKKLRQNLINQLPVYEAANETKFGIKVIVYFTEDEETRLFEILEELDMLDKENVITIDARNDNKPSGSRA